MSKLFAFFVVLLFSVCRAIPFVASFSIVLMWHMATDNSFTYSYTHPSSYCHIFCAQFSLLAGVFVGLRACVRVQFLYGIFQAIISITILLDVPKNRKKRAFTNQAENKGRLEVQHTIVYVLTWHRTQPKMLYGNIECPVCSASISIEQFFLRKCLITLCFIDFTILNLRIMTNRQRFAFKWISPIN